MKGLLLKDWYTLIKQMKIMLVLMLVFACVPGYSMAAFAVVYTAMLPVTAFAYDERRSGMSLRRCCRTRLKR